MSDFYDANRGAEEEAAKAEAKRKLIIQVKEVLTKLPSTEAFRRICTKFSEKLFSSDPINASAFSYDNLSGDTLPAKAINFSQKLSSRMGIGGISALIEELIAESEKLIAESEKLIAVQRPAQLLTEVEKDVLLSQKEYIIKNFGLGQMPNETAWMQATEALSEADFNDLFQKLGAEIAVFVPRFTLLEIPGTAADKAKYLFGLARRLAASAPIVSALLTRELLARTRESSKENTQKKEYRSMTPDSQGVGLIDFRSNPRLLQKLLENLSRSVGRGKQEEDVVQDKIAAIIEQLSQAIVQGQTLVEDQILVDIAQLATQHPELIAVPLYQENLLSKTLWRKEITYRYMTPDSQGVGLIDFRSNPRLLQKLLENLSRSVGRGKQEEDVVQDKIAAIIEQLSQAIVQGQTLVEDQILVDIAQLATQHPELIAVPLYQENLLSKTLYEQPPRQVTAQEQPHNSGPVFAAGGAVRFIVGGAFVPGNKVGKRGN